MAYTKIKLKDWTTPNYASLDSNTSTNTETGGYALAIKDLDPDALDGLVATWLSGVYKKAGRKQPWRNQPDTV